MSALLNAHGQQHLGMNMAADGKGAGARKMNIDCLTGSLLVRVKGHAARGDIDLVEEFILVRKEKGVAAIDRDLADAEGASLLNDSVRRGGARELRGRKEQQEGKRPDPARPQLCGDWPRRGVALA